MLIKKVNKNTFDVFFNEGWDNWGRFSVENNKLSQIAGIHNIPASIIGYLKKKYGAA